MKRPLLAAALCAALLDCPSLVQAARPFVTDDARVVDQGGCQVESFYKEQRAHSGSEFWLLPACNPSGLEVTIGGNRVESDRSAVFQLKTLIRPLKTNGAGFAASMGVIGGDPYANAIGSLSFLDDRAVVHINLGMNQDTDANVTRGTAGIGLEALLFAPRVYGILETYGQKGEKPTLHFGLRFWIVPNHFQVDATHGERNAYKPGTPEESPAQRFNTVGLRILW